MKNIIKRYNEFLNEAKYKKQKFTPNSVEVGDLLWRIDPQPGYYNHVKVIKINGESADVAWADYNGKLQGSKFEMRIKTLQDWKNNTDEKEWNKKEEINEFVFDLKEKIKFKTIKGGDLKDKKVVTELKKILTNLKNVSKEYDSESKTIPAGGFSGANSGTMKSVLTGVAIKIATNDVHRGGYYEGSTAFIVQVQVGGKVEYKISEALLKVAEEILNKYHYTGTIKGKEVTSRKVSRTSGTSWSSAYLPAPSIGNEYLICPELDGFHG